MQSVTVTIANPVSGFHRDTTTDAMGHYVFRNLPPNPYHVSASAQGFETVNRDVDVRGGVPIMLDLALTLAGATQTVEVVGHSDLVEADPAAHTDIDQSLVDKLPVEANGGLNQIITMASPGVVADSNGFFHPVGDHAQTQFSIDNQPISDQQSRVYSNQISPAAIQSMEVITGVPPAEYGDKTSLIVHIITKSGLDSKPAGDASVGYGSFRSPQGEFNIGAGSHTIGDFLSLTGLTTERYLDPPELHAIHDTGNSLSLFNRLDVHPNSADSLHLNIQAGRSSFAVPDTYDQQAAGQDQHQQIDSFNIAPGYTRVIGSKTLLTANAFVRRDRSMYMPSGDPFADLPASVSQDRTLMNSGVKADVTYSTAHNNVKFGGDVSATRLHEHFTFGITDAASGDFADENGDFDAATFGPYVLANGGSPFVFDDAATIEEQGLYVQDDIHAGKATVNVGTRLDHYAGLTTDTQLQPRAGLSYALATNTVLRVSYGRTMETPYNENLLLSAGFGSAGSLVGTGSAPPTGHRDEVEVGIQQAFGTFAVADVGYFNKHTKNGYDFNVLFDTPIAFPVAWDHSRLNGFTGKFNIVEHKGFSAFVVMAHTSAIFYPPGVGGVLLEQPGGPFRIDHDQKFNSTTNFQYAFARATGAWVALSWRYDSGLVAGSVGSLEDALGLTADQQAAIGLSCGGVPATLDHALTAAECNASNFTASRVRIPAEGTEDDVTNPPRITPRNVFDLGFGADNLFHTSKTKVRLHVTVVNLTNKEALLNFLSTFSGTHFLTPRAYTVQLGVAF